jgi:hypothetical protein
MVQVSSCCKFVLCFVSGRRVYLQAGGDFGGFYNASFFKNELKVIYFSRREFKANPG